MNRSWEFQQFLSLSKNSPHLLESKGLLLYSEGSATYPYPKPD